MTRKRFMKLMMGKGISRNVAREVVKTLREKQEAEDQCKKCFENGEFGRAIRVASEIDCAKRKLYGLLLTAKKMTQRFAEKTTR